MYESYSKHATGTTTNNKITNPTALYSSVYNLHQRRWFCIVSSLLWIVVLPVMCQNLPLYSSLLAPLQKFLNRGTNWWRLILTQMMCYFFYQVCVLCKMCITNMCSALVTTILVLPLLFVPSIPGNSAIKTASIPVYYVLRSVFYLCSVLCTVSSGFNKLLPYHQVFPIWYILYCLLLILLLLLYAMNLYTICL